MEWYQAIILGLVEGITEYLPISSTGHLIIAASVLGLDAPETKASVDAFAIVIQGGAILAVLGLYRNRVKQMLNGLRGRDAAGRHMFRNLVIAFMPAAILGVMLDELIEELLFYPIPVMAALGLGGLVLIMLTPWQKRFFRPEQGEDDSHRHLVTLETMSWRRALVIGLMQCVAMWPGTSRSMMTIVGGMCVGLRPKQAAEFSFLLGLPTLGGACVYKIAKNLTGEGPNMFETLGVSPLILGVAVATVSAALAIKWLVGYLSQHGLAIFGWYRLALCLVFGMLVWLEVLDVRPVEQAGEYVVPAYVEVDDPALGDR